MAAAKSVSYKLSTALQAVKLENHPGSRLRDPTATLVAIPADSILKAEGKVGQSGLIDVLWNGDAFSVYYEDLQEKAVIVNPKGN
jgi:hypothetical protein